MATNLNPEPFVRAVCKVFEAQPEDIVGEPGKRNLTNRRAAHALSWIIRKHTGLSFTSINEALNRDGKDWAIYHYRRAETLRLYDRGFCNKLAEVGLIVAANIGPDLEQPAPKEEVSELEDPPEISNMRMLVAEGDKRFIQRLMEMRVEDMSLA